MSAARTLTALGASLGQQIPTLVRAAYGELTTAPFAVSRADAEKSLEVLLDRLCLSLAVAKPVGLVTWAMGESQRIGRACVIDMVHAATAAIASAPAALRLAPGRLVAFLEVLSVEVERAALGISAAEEAEPTGESVTALLAVLAERDYGTCCHSKATAEWGRRLSRALGCDAETVEFVALCALLHDVGKISTPDSILLKAGPLDAGEWEVMRDHAAAGARVVNQIPSLERCAIIVRAHHERWDGGGYPDGLAGVSIPFEARVVAVADAFHAMISDRPYRPALPPRYALQLLAEGRGTQWDPNVVDAMIGMFNRRPENETDKKLSSA